MFTKYLKPLLLISFVPAVIGLSGCSTVSDEQIAELEALRTEVKSLKSEVGSVDAQRSSLEKEIAEKNAKLDECEKLRSETQKNLQIIQSK